MAEHVCPWWVGYLLVSPLRRLLQNPTAILAPYVRAEMTVIEPGPGMGFFTLELARLVGACGRVVAIDLQPRMIENLRRRAAKAGLSDRIETRLSRSGGLDAADLNGTVDFGLAFAVVHELPDPGHFFAEMIGALKPGGTLLVSEPTGHVTETAFNNMLKTAAKAGFRETTRPPIWHGHTVLLSKE
jgi:tRNA A58 N-methylase Trm61